jgi:hypothetical protein
VAKNDEQVAPAPANNPEAPKEVVKPDTEKIATTPQPRQHRRLRNEGHISEPRQEVAKSEGEIAKEQMMLALQIASASFNEAQRMIEAGNRIP